MIFEEHYNRTFDASAQRTFAKWEEIAERDGKNAATVIVRGSLAKRDARIARASMLAANLESTTVETVDSPDNGASVENELSV